MMTHENKLDQQLSGLQWAVHDGGIATELEFQGEQLDKDLWSALHSRTHPQQLKRVHKLYLGSGCNIITTASYQFSFEAFAKRGFSKQDAELVLRDSVVLCHEAREEYLKEHETQPATKRPILIAASLSCYGASIGSHEFDGDYVDLMDESQLYHFHKERLDSFFSLFINREESSSSSSSPRPDILLFETIPALKEALVICKLLERYLKELPDFPFSVIISFSCKDHLHTCHGEKIETCAEELSKFNFINAIGVNCTQPKYIASLVQQIDGVISNRSISHLHMLIYPNNGDIWDGKEFKWLPCDDGVNYETDYGRHVVHQIKSSISLPQRYKVIVGGCCRVRPIHISQVAHELNQYSN